MPFSFPSNNFSFKLLLGRFVRGIFGAYYCSRLSLGMAETPSLAFKVQLDKAMADLIWCWPWYHFEEKVGGKGGNVSNSFMPLLQNSCILSMPD